MSACSWVASARRHAYRTGAQIYQANKRPADAERLRRAWETYLGQFAEGHDEIVRSYLDDAYERGRVEAKRERNEASLPWSGATLVS